MGLIPGEFDDFRAPGLVSDQLNEEKSNAPFYEISKLTKFRKKFKKIYDVLPIFHWKINTVRGIWNRFKSSLFRIKQLNLLEELNKKLSSNISIEEKIKYSNQWITEIGNINNTNNEFVLYNNALEAVNDIRIWKEVFYPWKLIVVYRDPKDQLADIIKNEYLYAPYGAPSMNFGGFTLETIYGRSRQGAINFHIDAIKKRYVWVDSLKKELDSDRFLLIDFEGLANNYSSYKSIVENFIGNLKPHHRYQKLYFDPIEAKKSIGIYKNYLNDIEIESLIHLENWYKNMIQNNSILFNS